MGQVAVSMADRIAAVVSFAGSFHYGFNQAPRVPVPLMDLHGDADHQVPVVIQPGQEEDAPYARSHDGYFYTLLTDIFQGWRDANGCNGEDNVDFATPLDTVNDLKCTSTGKDCACNSTAAPCDTSPVVKCSFTGRHQIFPTKPEDLIWSFLSLFTKSSARV